MINKIISWKSKEWLEDQYITKCKSFKQIAHEIGKSDVYVGMVARKIGIQVRPIGDERAKKTKYLTKEIIMQLYNTNSTILEIATKFNLPTSVVLNKFRQYKLKTRERHISRRFRLDKTKNITWDVWATSEWLIEHYVNKQLSIKEITQLTGWGYGTTRSKIISFGIQIRDSSDAALIKSTKISERVKHSWQTIGFQNKMAKVFADRPKVSSIQEILYNILEDLGVKYFREYNDKSDDQECSIGGRMFDCVVPRVGRPTLLIECQGSYYHMKRDAQCKDEKKYSHIENIFPGQYEIKQLWEHEFSCESRVYGQLKHWLGLENVVEFDFSGIQIRQLPRPEAKKFFSAYHYLGGIGNRGAIIYGAYLDKKLIAAIVFSSLIRQNIPTGNLRPDEVREISRLCIHPQYHKKNFASWFVSKTLKLLPKQFKAVLAYADTTYNHVGVVYKACNFKRDRITTLDYWYCDNIGNKIHKKTLYNHARCSKMIESEFAKKFGYIKIFGSYKYRYIYMTQK